MAFRWPVLPMSLALLAAGCERANSPADSTAPSPVSEAPAEPRQQTQSAAEAAPPRDIYTVRGEIVALPGETGPNAPMQIRHEAIPDFKNREGEAVGMGAMTMLFPLAEEVSVEGFSKGDKVEFVFAVWPTPRMRWQITEIKKLPPETELEFGPAEEPLTTENG